MAAILRPKDITVVFNIPSKKLIQSKTKKINFLFHEIVIAIKTQQINNLITHTSHSAFFPSEYSDVVYTYLCESILLWESITTSLRSPFEFIFAICMGKWENWHGMGEIVSDWRENPPFARPRTQFNGKCLVTAGREINFTICCVIEIISSHYSASTGAAAVVVVMFFLYSTQSFISYMRIIFFLFHLKYSRYRANGSRLELA